MGGSGRLPSTERGCLRLSKDLSSLLKEHGEGWCLETRMIKRKDDGKHAERARRC